MKKSLTLVLVLLFIFSLTGCSKVKLDEGQAFTTFKSNGDLVLSAYISDNDADDAFNIDTSDKDSKIKKDLVDAFDENLNMKVKVTKLKANKDYMKFTITTDEGDNMGFDLKYTLSDYADDNGYEDVDALADEQDFVYFKNGKDVKTKDVSDYEDDVCVSVSGSSDGSYYKFPGKILILSDIDFEKISNDTIYVDSDEWGYVIFKK